MRAKKPSVLRILNLACCWASAVVLAVSPFVVAADFGGVLWWTQYIASLVLVVAIAFAIPAAMSPDCNKQLRPLILIVPLCLWAIYAWFQLLPLNARVVEHLSEGSFKAQTLYVQSFLSESGSDEPLTLSIAVDHSKHAFAVLLLLIGLVWASLVVFTTRNRIGMLLSVFALGATAHAVFGLYATVYPEAQVFGINPGPSRFGCFVNRNNAAFLLNIGIASGLGLLSWRLIALTGQEVDDPKFEVNDLIALVSDRESAIGVTSVVLCLTGLLACGSRGGLVAAVGGILLAFGWVRQRRGLHAVPMILAATVLCAALLLVPLNLDLESLRRFGESSNTDVSTMIRDGRLNHWRDGFASAMTYFPSGSGLGTYAYAYLPYQEFSSHTWYHHADNLWLELFVEQGIAGLLFAGMIFAIWIWSLTRLSNGANPIDQGLRVTGWYLLGVVVLSQCFDFGLIIPANLFLICILLSAIVSRGMSVEAGGGTISFAFFRTRLLWYGSGIFALSASALGAYLLKSDAMAETVARRAKLMLPSAISLPDALAEIEQELRDQLQSTPSAFLYDILSDVQYRRARIDEVVKLNPRTAEEAIAAYEATGVLARRKKALLAEKSADSADTDLDIYSEALQSSQQSLRRLPLGIEARLKQVYLDFVHRDVARTREALVQLQQFYKSNGEMLVRLGRFAADSGEKELAVSLWTSALESDPKLTPQVIAAAEQVKAIELQEVIPNNSAVFRQVADYVIQHAATHSELAARTLQGLDCDSCTSKKERADCLRLAGDLAFTIGKFDQAFENYRAAIIYSPTDSSLHLQLIEQLRSRGRRLEARQAAYIALEVFPDDVRFTTILNQLASEDIRDIESKG